MLELQSSALKLMHQVLELEDLSEKIDDLPTSKTLSKAAKQSMYTIIQDVGVQIQTGVQPFADFADKLIAGNNQAMLNQHPHIQNLRNGVNGTGFAEKFETPTALAKMFLTNELSADYNLSLDDDVVTSWMESATVLDSYATFANTYGDRLTALEIKQAQGSLNDKEKKELKKLQSDAAELLKQIQKFRRGTEHLDKAIGSGRHRTTQQLIDACRDTGRLMEARMRGVSVDSVDKKEKRSWRWFGSSSKNLVDRKFIHGGGKQTLPTQLNLGWAARTVAEIAKAMKYQDAKSLDPKVLREATKPLAEFEQLLNTQMRVDPLAANVPQKLQKSAMDLTNGTNAINNQIENLLSLRQHVQDANTLGKLKAKVLWPDDDTPSIPKPQEMQRRYLEAIDFQLNQMVTMRDRMLARTSDYSVYKSGGKQ